MVAGSAGADHRLLSKGRQLVSEDLMLCVAIVIR